MNYTKVKYFAPAAYYKIIMLTYPPLTKENAEAESLAQSAAMQMSGLVWYPRYLFQELLENISVWIFVPIQINKNPSLVYY